MLSGDPVDTLLNIVVFVFVGVLIALLLRSDLPASSSDKGNN